jgi:hypothetical protein
MKNRVREERFEFVFYINGHIIVQRFFQVPEYNKDFRTSYEVKELMDSLMGMNNGDLGYLGLIPNNFKERNMDADWGYYNPMFVQTSDQVNPKDYDLFEREDIFSIDIKVDRRVVASGQFCGNYFPKYMRYQVDITGIIPDIISEITDYMSLDTYTPVLREELV